MQRLSRQRFVDVQPILKREPALPHCVSMTVAKAMTLDPEKRYQSPAAMLVDLEIVSRRLQELSQAAVGGPSPDDTQVETVESARKLAAQTMLGRTVLVVESNGQMQEIFRTGFKKAGYRVLLISDPSRAVSRLFQDSIPPDCVLINAQNPRRNRAPRLQRIGREQNHRLRAHGAALGRGPKSLEKTGRCFRSPPRARHAPDHEATPRGPRRTRALDRRRKRMILLPIGELYRYL